MDFITGAILGSALSTNYSHSHALDLSDISDKIEQQNEIIKENNKRNIELKKLKLKVEYFKRYTDEELIELLNKTPEYIENERFFGVSGGIGNEFLYKRRYSTKDKNKKYQDILNEIKRRKLEFE